MESVLESCYDYFELLLFYKCYTGSNRSRISRFLRDNRIHLISISRKEIATALNAGIAHARGDLVARMVADNIMHPERKCPSSIISSDSRS